MRIAAPLRDAEPLGDVRRRTVVFRAVATRPFDRVPDFVVVRVLVAVRFAVPFRPCAPLLPFDVVRLLGAVREPEAALGLAADPFERGDLEVVVRLAARFRFAVDACLGLAVAVRPISGKRPSRQTRSIAIRSVAMGDQPESRILRGLCLISLALKEFVIHAPSHSNREGVCAARP